MNEAQIRKWLRKPEREKLAPWLIKGLADVPAPVPGDNLSHIRAYQAALDSCPMTVDLMPAVTCPCGCGLPAGQCECPSPDCPGGQP